MISALLRRSGALCTSAPAPPEAPARCLRRRARLSRSPHLLLQPAVPHPFLGRRSRAALAAALTEVPS